MNLQPPQFFLVFNQNIKWFLQSGDKRDKGNPWKKVNSCQSNSWFFTHIHTGSSTQNSSKVDFICIRWSCCYLEFFLYQYLTPVVTFKRVFKGVSAFAFTDRPLMSDRCLRVGKTVILGWILVLCNTNGAALWRYSHGGSWKGQTAQSCTLSHGSRDDNTRNPVSWILYHLLCEIFLCVSFHVKETSMLFNWTFNYHILTALTSLVYLVLCLINRFMQHRLYMCKALSNIYMLKSINVLRELAPQ